MRTLKNTLHYFDLKYYLVLALTAILAFFPVSSMLFSLKNDVMVFEYPIKYFISECLRNGEFPYWFNTWNMGFPLQSILSWGVFSTPQMLIGILTTSNIYILQSEFIFYIIIAGCFMFKLLKSHFITDKKLALLFALSYMLSGFTVGSSQWIFYITGMAFIPLVFYFLISLLRTPSLKYSVLLSISVLLLFTNVHIYLTIVSAYFFIAFLILYFINLFFLTQQPKELFKKISFQISLSFLFTFVLCAFPAYYTIEVLNYLDRSQPLLQDSTFFQSNYLHPYGLSSLLFPLSSISSTFYNTEGIIQNTYIGLLPLILFPTSLLIAIKQKNKFSFVLLAGSLLFMVISFGHLTPLRSWMNFLPGMLYFRHPGLLRLFFIFLFILFLANNLKHYTIVNLLTNTFHRKITLSIILLLTLISIITLINNYSGLFSLWKGGAYESLKFISKTELISISSLIQLFLCLTILYLIIKNLTYLYLVIIFELVFNTFIITPFFSVSTYSVKKVTNILNPKQGFPIQESSPHNVVSTIKDSRNNKWYNYNTYQKEISNNLSMSGPLIFDRVSKFIEDKKSSNILFDKKIIFINDTIISEKDEIKLINQTPSKLICKISLTSSKEIILQQAFFPGWKAYYNDMPLDLRNSATHLVSTQVPQGTGMLVFKFEKPGVLFSAVAIHLIVIMSLLYFLIKKIILYKSRYILNNI